MHVCIRGSSKHSHVHYILCNYLKNYKTYKMGMLDVNCDSFSTITLTGILQCNE